MKRNSEKANKNHGGDEVFNSRMDYFQKAKEVFNRDGLFPLIRNGIPFIHERIIQPRLPRVYETQYNDVIVRSGRPLDGFFPWVDNGPRPQYESALVDAIDKHVCSGDKVLIVGGGWGVTATHAARHVGESGQVLVYEGAASEVEKVRKTAQRNAVTNQIDVEHAIIGPANNLRGNPGDAKRLPPSDLPDCDVLLLDCEGAETTILPELEAEPNVIAVESHGHFEAPSDVIVEQLSERGYEVVRKVVADKGKLEECIERDVHVLTGVNKRT